MADDDDTALRITWRKDGRVEVWSDRARPMAEIVRLLRAMADGFENDPTRVG